ncbi:glutaminase [Caenimonas sedimenti]|uniref:Glutaminase n=1 Tax=Caenimonas sedimenti TaxID=2596921 RepID=A0A562ZIZ2_9BURK|nr:glutaminase [Caenimonas sedimenti]TWO68453.1 glutaminase [Caenimonas sedimenti]
MQFQALLEEIVATLRPELGREGQVASYIPALARVPAAQFGIALRTCDGHEAQAGDSTTPFSIQSISKLFTLTLGMREMGETLWERIGREPSGNPFNSLVQLESEHGVPRNPFINAGAIAVTDRLVSLFDAKAEMLTLLSSLCEEPIRYDEEVAASEAATGFRNVAMANFMKSFGRIDNDVAAVLDAYFHHCAVRMSCAQLARAVGFLCRDGVHPATGQQLLTERQARRVNSLMLTCGTYDAAGEFAFRIGLPCKSGVGGGIVAVVPDRLTLCVWSPALESSGNSLLGMKALEMFTAKTGLSIF